MYEPGFLNEDEQRQLLRTVGLLGFQPFEFHGYIAKRRIVEYGWEYDFSSRAASRAPDIPEYLLPVKQKAAALAAVPPDALVEAVVTEYPPGAPIGWHRDVPQFELVIGISLVSACRMRFKPYRREGKIVSVILDPGSAYVLSGDARWKYQHSISPVEALRYSITFRTIRRQPKRRAS